MRPIGIDLFAGAGGLSLGFECAGFDIAAAVEIDPIHCATHEFNFPYCATICRSALDIDGDEIRNVAGIGTADIAVVIGGAPCQGFSAIGRRMLEDPRNELVHHFARLVRQLKPAYFAFENVKGLTVGKQRQLLDAMIEAFVPEYHVVLPFKVLNASDYGVPQDRHRLFLLGARQDWPKPIYPKAVTQSVTVEAAINDLPDPDEFEVLSYRDWTVAEFGTPSDYARKLRGLVRDPEDFGYPRQTDRSLLTGSVRTAHTETSRQRFAATGHGKTEPISRLRKLDPKGRCNAIRAGTARDRGALTSPRPIHPFAARVITKREAARLHSYPDWFRFHVTKWHGFRQIGNSVPPLLARAVAAEIMRALGYAPSAPEYTLALGDPALLELSMSEAAQRYGVPDDVIPKRRRQRKPSSATKGSEARATA